MKHGPLGIVQILLVHYLTMMLLLQDLGGQSALYNEIGTRLSPDNTKASYSNPGNGLAPGSLQNSYGSYPG